MAAVSSISIDLDGLPHYYGIHGQVAPKSAGPCTAGLRRFLDLLQEKDLKATFFVIGQDLDDPEFQEQMRRAIGAGHELANHTWSHAYDLTRSPSESMRQEISRCHRQVAEVLNVEMVGFRAPGYTITNSLLDVVQGLGYRYDSSVFPCPLYYGAKASVLGAMALFKKNSRAILGPPQVLLAPTEPYRPDTLAWWTLGHRPLWEIPIGVEPWSRWPFIGTALVTMGRHTSTWLAQRMCKRDFVGLECHGVDLMDADDVGVNSTLAQSQRDLRIPWNKKARVLGEVLDVLAAGRNVDTLAQYVTRLPGQGLPAASP